MDCGPSSDISYGFTISNLKECPNMHSKNKDSYNPDIVRNYCKLTDKLCVADEFGIIERLMSKSSINEKILNRCPSREISDVVKEKGDL